MVAAWKEHRWGRAAYDRESKGALFMDALRRELGEDAFWAGLKRFTRQFAGKAATSRGFQRVYQESSGRDLSPLFEKWVY